MTTEDMIAIAIVGLAAAWWLWKHPTAAQGIGLVVLVGLVCFGAAHARTHARRQNGHRRRCRR
jgi:hypothetical protein